MKTSRTIKSLVFLSFVVLFSAFASANVFVVGKTFVGEIGAVGDSSVTVYVDCTFNGSKYLKSTTSKADGSYGVGFNDSECGASSLVEIHAVKGNKYVDKFSVGSGIPSGNDTIFIKNVVLDKTKVTSGSSGGSGGHSSYRKYNCGNGVCDSGESATLCPEDCKEEVVVENSVVVEEENETDYPATEFNFEDEKEEPTFISGITGAVVGALGKTGSVVSGVAIFLVLGSFGTVMVRRKFKKGKAGNVEDSVLE